jgi:hypothetical protein
MSENEEKKIRHLPGYWTAKEVYEQCIRPKGTFPGFLVYRRDTDQLSFEISIKDTADGKGIEVRPMRHSFWPLAFFSQSQEGPLPKIDPKQVFDLVREFVYDFVELPHETLYDILTLWIMSSYLREKFDAVSYLAFIGPKDSGKTRALEVIAQLAFRALLSPSCSPAGIFRLIQKYCPTLCLDETEIYGSEQKTEAIAVLNCGYKKGQYVFRYNKDKNEMEAFSVFGHKALASTDIFIPTLESRSIVVNMRKNTRPISVFLDKERAANLRFTLLIYRINILMGKEPILEDRDSILSFLSVKNGRLAELFYLLISVAPSDEIRIKVNEYALELGNKRQEEEKTTVAAELIEAVVFCRDQVEGGKLTIEDITDTFNTGKDESQRLNTRTIGRELKKLGFDQTRVSGGCHAIFYNENLVNNLSKRFLSREMSQTSLTSLMSPNTSNNKNDVSDNSDLSDNSKKENLKIEDISIASSREVNSEEKVCAICSQKKATNWVAMTKQGMVADICPECATDFLKRKKSTESKT